MAIQKEFVVRFRSGGYVRFHIPERAASAQAAAGLIEKIGQIGGVSSVRLFKRSRKLVIRYRETECSFIQLAQGLYAALAELDKQGCFDAKDEQVSATFGRFSLRRKFKNNRLSGWFSDKVTAAKETAQAAKILGKLSTKGSRALIKDPEKAVIDFLNDILVLYLIKLHWTRITQQWLVKPFVHRYEWLATFYLFFLLVRSRRPKPTASHKSTR